MPVRPALCDDPDPSGAEDLLSRLAFATAATGGSGFEQVIELKVLLDTVDQDRRTALVLTQIIGLTYAEAATVIRCPIGTVRSRVARGREELFRAGAGSR